MQQLVAVNDQKTTDLVKIYKSCLRSVQCARFFFFIK